MGDDFEIFSHIKRGGVIPRSKGPYFLTALEEIIFNYCHPYLQGVPISNDDGTLTTVLLHPYVGGSLQRRLVFVVHRIYLQYLKLRLGKS